MKLSLKWLNEFIDVSDLFKSPEKLSDKMTFAGLEVEAIENPAKALENVVVGQILKKDKHPNADKLSVCQVATGEGVVHQIVCGAQNHKDNDKVILALPGAVLPGNFQIKKSALRGVESGGMLCSYKEVGMSLPSEGIIILPENTEIGKPAAEALGLDDVVFELKVTPNRADALSHLGLAREVSALLDRPLKVRKTDLQTVAKETSSEIKVNVKNAEACPRYTGRIIDQVKVGPSPEWLKSRIESVGLNSINNIVDCTNLVLMELGQPLHAFDFSEIKGGEVIVRNAEVGEVFKTLDGTDLKLKGEELMIADQTRSLCMAGVIGGLNSGVTDSTTKVFLESATFNSSSVRKASRSHGLNTDSGYRFSRGVDPHLTRTALDRASELIAQVSGGVVYTGVIDTNPNPKVLDPVVVSLKTISDRLGFVANLAKAEMFFTRLGCDVLDRTEGGLVIRPPTFRFDLESEIDFVEEYARLEGYDQIPETLPAFHQGPTAHDQNYVKETKVAQKMVGLGFFEAINSVLTSQTKEQNFLGDLNRLKKLNLRSELDTVGIRNPLNEDLNILRTSLAYGLFQNVVHNFHQGVEAGALFEFGSVFSKKDAQYLEKRNMGAILWGENSATGTGLWGLGKEIPAALVLKQKIETVLSLVLPNWEWVSLVRADVPSFVHWGQVLGIKSRGKLVGVLGTLHPSLIEEAKIRVPVAVLELSVGQDAIVTHKIGARIDAPIRFPAVERDLALVMNRTVTSKAVKDLIKKSADSKFLQSVTEFDLYEGEKLDARLKSIAYRLRFQDSGGTLQEGQIQPIVDKVLAALKEQLQAVLR